MYVYRQISAPFFDLPCLAEKRVSAIPDRHDSVAVRDSETAGGNRSFEWFHLDIGDPVAKRVADQSHEFPRGQPSVTSGESVGNHLGGEQS